MSVTYNDGRDVCVGDGANDTFAYTFKIFSEDDIQVYVGGGIRVLTTHYSVTGVGNDGGGTVVFTFAMIPPNHYAVELVSNCPYTQPTDWVSSPVFDPQTFENSLDRMTIQAMQVRDRLDGRVTISVKGNEVVNNSSTFQDDDDIELAMAVKEVWFFELSLMVSGPVAAGLKLQWTYPAGCEMYWGTSDQFQIATGITPTTFLTEADSLTMETITDKTPIRLLGWVVNSETAGDLQLQWAQNVATVGDTTIYKNSFIRSTRVSP